jgi:hypothetical protein
MKIFGILVIVISIALSEVVNEIKDSSEPSIIHSTVDFQRNLAQDPVSDIETQFEVENLYDGIETPENYEQTTGDEINSESKEDSPIIQTMSDIDESLIASKEGATSPILTNSNTVVKEPTSIVYQMGAYNMTNTPTPEEVFIKGSQEANKQRSWQYLHNEYLKIALRNLENLEQQLRDASKEAHNDSPKLMSPQMLKLLDSFLNHLDFTEDSPAPSMYNYFLDENVSLSSISDSYENSIVKRNPSFHNKLFKFDPFVPNTSQFSHSHVYTIRNPAVNSHLSQESGISISQKTESSNHFKTKTSTERAKEMLMLKNLHAHQVTMNNGLPNRSSQRPAAFYKSYAALARPVIRKLPQTRTLRKKLPKRRTYILHPKHRQIYKSPISKKLKSFETFKYSSMPYSLTIDDIPSLLLLIGDVRNFFEGLFRLIPEPSGDKPNAEALSRGYQKMKAFIYTYSNGIMRQKAALKTIEQKLKIFSDGPNSLFVFYKKSSLTLSQTDKLITDQTIVLSQHISDMKKSVSTISSDINRLDGLIKVLKLPSSEKNLSTTEFINTITYKNLKLPNISQEQNSLPSHLADLKMQMEMIKSQDAVVSALVAGAITPNNSAISSLLPLLLLLVIFLY